MEIKQVFNNNVVLTTNDDANEFVVMGRGIGFQKAKGDSIDLALIEKKFILSENVSKSIFPDIYHQLSDDEIDVVIEIIDLAEEMLGIEFKSNIYIALADHIHYALDRTQQLIPFTNQLNKSLDKEEASYIDIHIITCKKVGYLIRQTIKVTEIVHYIINIIRVYYGDNFDEESISYARFLTHIQFFAQRVVFGDHQGD